MVFSRFSLAAVVRVGCLMRPVLWERPLAPTRVLHSCRAQLDTYDDFGGGDGGMKPPSDKQIQYAQRLSTQHVVNIPDAAYTDSRECSRFIDDMLSRTPPSEKQIRFAQTLAERHNVPLPQEAQMSSKAVSEFIDRYNTMGAPVGGAAGYGQPAYPPPLYSPGYQPPMGAPMGAGGLATQPFPGGPSDKQLVFAVNLARELKRGIAYEVGHRAGSTRLAEQVVPELAACRGPFHLTTHPVTTGPCRQGRVLRFHRRAP